MIDSKKQEEAGPNRLVSLRDLAVEWGASRQTVRRALRRAGIKPVFLNDARNGTLRYSRGDVEKFIESCRSDSRSL